MPTCYLRVFLQTVLGRWEKCFPSMKSPKLACERWGSSPSISKHNLHSSHIKDGGVYILISQTLFFFFFSFISTDCFTFSFVSRKEVCIPVWLVYPHHWSEFTDQADRIWELYFITFCYFCFPLTFSTRIQNSLSVDFICCWWRAMNALCELPIFQS